MIYSISKDKIDIQTIDQDRKIIITYID